MRMRSLMTMIIVAICTIGAAAAAPIHDAAAKGDLAKVKQLIQAKPSLVNAKDKDGATPLHHAVAKGNKAVVEFLLANKANIEAAKNDGVRPVHIAVALGRLDILELLASKKVDLNAIDASRRTPLSIAKQKGNTSIIEFLVAQGARDAANPPIVPATAPATAPSSVSPVTDLAKLSTDLVQAMAQGQYSAVASHFDATMKAAIPPNKLGEMWTTATSQLGQFKRTSRVKMTEKDGFNVALVTSEFTNATVEFQFSYNNKQQVSGLYVKKPE